MRHRKSQLATLEFMIAITISVIILATISFIWVFYEKKIDDTISYNDLVTKTFQISDTLVKIQGVPSNWDSNNVDVIGLAFEDRKISKEKLNQFINMDEQDIKSKIKTNYDFYINLKYTNGTSIGSVGAQNENRTQSVNIKRYVFYENETAIMEFEFGE